MTSDEREQKKSLISLLEKIHELLGDFGLKFNKFELFNYEHFAEMERQVELRCERLKIKIDEISEEMIQLIKEKKK